jgi:hypothetical protein
MNSHETPKKQNTYKITMETVRGTSSTSHERNRISGTFITISRSKVFNFFFNFFVSFFGPSNVFFLKYVVMNLIDDVFQMNNS